MRMAYLDCPSGISGDMTLAALVDAGADLCAIQEAIDSLGLPDCRLVASEIQKRGFRSVQVVVEHAPEHADRHLSDITAMIDRAEMSPRARATAKRVFQKLAEAEAKVHGTTIDKVHFHEVGAVDSIADIVGAAIGFDLMDIDRVVCSPIPTGRGFVEIAHGRCSIPAPATGELLRGVPLAPSDVEGELTTPTGAAMIAAMASEFGPLPPMTVERIGYGAGQKDFPHPNILRLFLGSLSTNSHRPNEGNAPYVETIVVLETNLDDCPGDVLAHAVDRLWAVGALDVTVTPVQMKKNRPGLIVAVQAEPSGVGALEGILLRETTTLGVRRSLVQRTVLVREPREVETRWGIITGKVAHLPDGSQRFTPEYETCHRVSIEQGVPLGEVMSAARQAFSSRPR